MYGFKIKLADKYIFVDSIYQSTERFCREYITDGDRCDIRISISEEDISAERERSENEQRLEGVDVINYSPSYLETLALYRKIADAMIAYDTLLFHGSAFSVDGDGYIFTAKSGTGKSTHTRLWREAFGERVFMVNDDKPLIRITDGEARVFGTPWCGKHNIGTNTSVPLRGIISLSRGDENNIVKGSKNELFPKILSQIYRTKDISGLQRTLVLTDKLLGLVELYELSCNMNPDAPIVAYEGLRGKDK